MASHQKTVDKDKSDSITKSTSHQDSMVDDKETKWNRDIPEVGYITLGTFRCGVLGIRQSNRLSAASLEYRPGVLSTNLEIDRLSVYSAKQLEGSDCNITNTAKRKVSCCCSGSNGIVLPCWKTEENKSNLRLTTKNRSETALLSTRCCKTQSQQRNETEHLPPIVDFESAPKTLTTKLNVLHPNSTVQLKKRKFIHKQVPIKISSGLSSSSSSTSTSEILLNKKSSIPLTFSESKKSTTLSTPTIKQSYKEKSNHSPSSSVPLQSTSTSLSSSSLVASSLSSSLKSTSTLDMIKKSETHSDNANTTTANISTQTPPNTNSISVNVDTISSSLDSSYYEDENSISNYIREWPNNSNTSHSESVLFELCSSETTKSPTLSFESSKLDKNACDSSSSQISQVKVDKDNLKSKSIIKSSSFRNSVKQLTKKKLNSQSLLDENNFENSFSQNNRNRASSIPTKLNSPPPVPPKPKHIHQTNTEDNDDHLLLAAAYDPLNFHQKIQNFEKQITTNENSKNISVVKRVDNDEQENEKRCEFFGCFSTIKNINSDRNSCSSNCDQNPVIEFNINENVQNYNNNINKNTHIEAFNEAINLQNSLSSPSIIDRNIYDKNLTDRRKLCYDSNGRLKNITELSNLKNPIRNSDNINNNNNDHNNSISDFRLKQFIEPIIRPSSGISSSSVVIRKLTPKLSRKLNCFNDQSVVSHDNEDYLIRNNNQNTNASNTNAIVHRNPNPTYPASFHQLNYNENESEIDFIDSSNSIDCDHIRSSHSDLDLTDLELLSKSNKKCNTTTTTLINNKSCNLSFDSVPKYLCKNTNNNYTNNNNNNYNNNQSLLVKDVYNSLSDIDSSTISCLSEENINCFCPNVNEIAITNNNQNFNENCANINNPIQNDINLCYCDSKFNNKIQIGYHSKENSEDFSNLNSPSPQSISPLGVVKGPLLKRVSPIESFGFTQINGRENCDKEIMMERRRNTLDRLQALSFGRRSTPSPSNQDKSKKTLEKSERLKELTERLRGNRSSPTPPPIPPPRKPRHGLNSQSNSVEKVNKSTESINCNSPLSSVVNDDIIHMDEEEEIALTSHPISEMKMLANEECEKTVECDLNKTQQTLYQQLKPNTSVSNLENLLAKVEYQHPTVSEETPEVQTKLPRPEARTVIGSYTQRGIPYRSVSFSQIDYSSGKYINSVALREKLCRNKLNELPGIDRASPTLPKKYDETQEDENSMLDLGSCSHTDSTNIPLKKSEVNINLRYDNEGDKIPLQDVVRLPNVIMEEEGTLLEIEINDENPSTSIKHESNSPSKQNSIIEELDESILPSTLINEKPLVLNSTSSLKASDPIKVNSNSDLYDSNLGTLMEEEIPLESPPETFLQTATTCLIPVPVYECNAQEWNNENPPQQWVDVASDEIGPIPEIVDSLTTTDKLRETISNAFNNDELPIMPNTNQDFLPIISVSHHTSSSNSLTEKTAELQEEQIKEKSVQQPLEKNSSQNLDRVEVTIERSFEDSKFEKEGSIDFSEVKKRYSNDDCESGERLPWNDYQRGSSLEEKSKRRKGRYFEGTDWVQTAREVVEQENHKALELDVTIAHFSKINSDQNSDFLVLSSPAIDDCQTPCSSYSIDPNTPESEYCNRQPIWPKGKNRRTSLSAQSSEEKDDCIQTTGQLPKAGQNLLFPRTDSISDNESDKTPSSRDRTSPSPAPSDQDFKRYSKRPLRGPYGMMLEAEMKKPNKKHFEEILEELKDPESISTRRMRSNDNRSFDDSIRHAPQYSNSMRVRKSNTYLPIPSHTRAASTPSQMENVNTFAGLEKINPLQKRYQSSLDNSTMSIDDKNFKQFSLDENSRRDNSPKRASSEIKHYPKRSLSNVSEKQQKRSLEEINLIQSSRTPSERSILTDSIGNRNSGVGGGNSSMSESTGSNILATPELLAALLKGSSEILISEQRQQMFQDTRTHVVQEIYRNEQSYVESLQTVVVKYFKVLKTPEHAGMIDSRTVDEIFFMVPEILEIHQKFLSELKFRLDSWAPEQKVGDAFIETFSKTEVLETYTSFVNNCNRAKDAIRTTKQARPSFARFLETTAREHKGKLSLDNLLIKPVQKFPNYEMLFTRLIKHTDADHPDQKYLKEVLKLVHDTLVHINCKEREILENGLREATLRELEGVIEGITELVAADRQFLLFDLVSMPSGQGARKERGFFLFNDLLVITSIKRRSGTIRKPNATTCPGSVASTLDTNKYKFLTKVSLDNLEIVKTKDENVRRIMNEIEQLADDCNKLQQIAEISATVRYPHMSLEETIREVQRDIQRQLSERQSNDAQLNMLELTANSPGGSQPLTVVFNKAEKRSQWEESFNEAKQKLAASLERHPIPEFMTSIPIRKTRAGLQFTCAAPTLSEQKDVWVCNSDGYVGQVCVMSLSPEPNVTSCNGVCNARILCVASVPAYTESPKEENRPTSEVETVQEFRRSNSPNCHLASKQGDKKKSNSGSDIQLDSNSSSDDSEAEGASGRRERMPSPAPASMTSTANKATSHHGHQDSNPDENDGNQSTMWLGTEDGCIHVYNCTDNIRIKKNKIKIQHVAAVFSILYLDNRVFVSLANGDICVYLRDNVGWNTNGPLCISIGTVSSPVNKLLSVHGKLWCSIQGIIKVLDTKTLQVESQIQISTDSKPITNMAVSSNYVWLSIQNSAHIKCFHSNNHELLFEVNLAPCVNKMLSNCDDIIRQHKAACLRVTSLLSCKDLIWIGTSAGVLLTIPAQGYGKGNLNVPAVTGIPHGHTGHVRFLTFVETGPSTHSTVAAGNTIVSGTESTDSKNKRKHPRSSTHTITKSETSNILIISGGDGYEDFRNSGANSLSEIAGREDSTNHLLIWQI